MAKAWFNGAVVGEKTYTPRGRARAGTAQGNL